MNHGPGWIVFEESRHQRTRKLLSILPARREPRDVACFMEQIYVDRFASLRERLSYKKKSKKSPIAAVFKAMRDIYNNTIHVGHEPFYVGIRAHKITLKGNVLEFWYKIAANVEDPHNPKFEDRCQSLVVDV
jgi:hypothetical protein